jgi:hypothetical protein
MLSGVSAYRVKANESNVIDCDKEQLDDNRKEVCKFNIQTSLGSECTEENDYGYKNGTPCVLLKVNKVSYQ